MAAALSPPLPRSRGRGPAHTPARGVQPYPRRGGAPARRVPVRPPVRLSRAVPRCPLTLAKKAALWPAPRLGPAPARPRLRAQPAAGPGAASGFRVGRRRHDAGGGGRAGSSCGAARRARPRDRCRAPRAPSRQAATAALGAVGGAPGGSSPAGREAAGWGVRRGRVRNSRAASWRKEGRWRVRV